MKCFIVSRFLCQSPSVGQEVQLILEFFVCAIFSRESNIMPANHVDTADP